MILIIKESSGEYEDYFSWNEKVYEITDTKEKVKENYYNHMKDKFAQVGLEVYPSPLENFTDFKMAEKHYRKRPGFFYQELVEIKRHRKLFNKVIKENNFYSWIEHTYSIKPLLFADMHLF